MGEKKIKRITLDEAIQAMGERLTEFSPLRFNCVYFLFKKGELVYVGQTSDLDSRIRGHRQTKSFDRVFYFKPKKGDAARRVESALIGAIRPPLNFTSPRDTSAQDLELLGRYGLEVTL